MVMLKLVTMKTLTANDVLMGVSTANSAQITVWLVMLGLSSITTSVLIYALLDTKLSVTLFKYVYVKEKFVPLVISSIQLVNAYSM